MKSIEIVKPEGVTPPLNLYNTSQPDRYFVWVSQKLIRDQVLALARAVVDKPNLTVVPVLRGAGPFSQMLGRMLHSLKADHSFTEFHVIAKRTRNMELADEPVRLFMDHIEPDEVNGRTLLILEDILDSGRTLTAVQERIQFLTKTGTWAPREVLTAVVLHKKKPDVSLRVTYPLFEVPAFSPNFPDREYWFGGFGMDVNLGFRNLEDIIEVRSPIIY